MHEEYKSWIICLQVVQERPTEISDALIGGNASAEGGGDEGGEAAMDPTLVTGVDVVLRARMVETGFQDKKAYQGYIKVSMEAGGDFSFSVCVS